MLMVFSCRVHVKRIVQALIGEPERSIVTHMGVVLFRLVLAASRMILGSAGK